MAHLLLGLSKRWIKCMAFVSFVLLLPCANLPISFEAPSSHCCTSLPNLTCLHSKNLLVSGNMMVLHVHFYCSGSLTVVGFCIFVCEVGWKICLIACAECTVTGVLSGVSFCFCDDWIICKRWRRQMLFLNLAAGLLMTLLIASSSPDFLRFLKLAVTVAVTYITASTFFVHVKGFGKLIGGTLGSGSIWFALSIVAICSGVPLFMVHMYSS